MKFIVGVGNPGPKYDGTRHNIGFEVLDRLAGKAKWAKEARLDALAADWDGVRLIKPLTFVNKSGDSVGLIADRHGAKPEDILVVCDDVNLMFGKFRLRASGSAGGHHGLESVIARIGSEDFPRLRLGVGSEKMPKDDISDFVLGAFDAGERKEIGEILEKAVQVCEAWARLGYAGAEKRLSQLQSNKK